MNRYLPRSAAAKWCHVVCTMYRRHERLKIPATARFCERSIRDSCSLPGWKVHGVSVSPDQVRLLLRTPRGTSRGEVIRAVKKSAGSAVRRSGVISPWWYPRVWGERSWCFVVRNPIAMARIRECLAVGYSKSGPLLPAHVVPFRWPEQSQGL
jgi:REP element-mobilizing transposase RayT